MDLTIRTSTPKSAPGSTSESAPEREVSKFTPQKEVLEKAVSESAPDPEHSPLSVLALESAPEPAHAPKLIQKPIHAPEPSLVFAG